MKKIAIMITVIFMAVLFLGVSVSGAVESASQYKSVYPMGGYKMTHNPDNVTTKLGFQGGRQNTWLFRFYIPPAVKDRVSLAVFCPQNQMIGVVVRLGFPPQCNVAGYSTSTSASEDYFYGLPWLSAAGFSGGSLQQFRDNDIRIRNHSGTIPIVKDYSPSSDGEWLYVKVLYDGRSAPNLAASNFEVTIDTNAYKAWYATASWDSSGNPLPNGITPTHTGNCNFVSTGEDDPPVDNDPNDDPFAPFWPPYNPPIDPDPDPIVHDPSECNWMWSLPGTTLIEASGLSMTFKEGEDAECPWGAVTVSIDDISVEWEYETSKYFLTVFGTDIKLVFARMWDGRWVLVYDPVFVMEEYRE
ncbi:MAG: hypothetical protein JRF53_00495 [Deltaproteobacteria bacterium]|nr:hypothetical protein [Deltaproteobacteria bacterium]